VPDNIPTACPALAPAVAPSESLPLDGDGETDDEDVDESDEDVDETDVVVDGAPEEVTERDADTVDDVVTDAVTVEGDDGVVDGEAPRERVAVGVRVPVGVGDFVAEFVPVGLAVSVLLLDTDIGDDEADAVMDADAPGDRGGVEDALVVDDTLTVVVAESEAVGVPLRDAVAVAESLLVGDAVGV
jgi:hypothetical protein